MTTRHFGAPVRRNEDATLLTGQATFVADVRLESMLHAAVLRADVAHGVLGAVDTSAARRMPGIVAVFTAEDLGEQWAPFPLLVPPPPIAGLTFNTATHVPLARDRVRHVGEPIAVVVATDRYLAEDALAEIVVEVEPLPVVADIEGALSADATLLHPHLGSNLAAHAVQQKGDYEHAYSRADHVVSRRFVYDRGTSVALETRGVVASWDAQSSELTVWDTTQAPIPIRNALAARFGLLESQVRVIAPFIGGGFGPKVMFYPEEVLIPWISMRLGRPVRWIEDRQEAFFATTQERGQVHEAELALASNGTILGARDVFLHDTGAYAPYGLTVPINTQCTLLGPYRVPAYYSEFRVVFTNRPIVTPIRGAGRQHGVFVMERLLDFAARDLGLDPVEIRRRNYLRPDEFPHNHQIYFQDSAPLRYDSGNYLPALEKAADMIGYAEFGARKSRARSEGRRLGVGIVSYVEGTGIGPYEGVRITVDPSGRVRLATGVGTQGQGHFTSFAQIAADHLGVAVEDVMVSTGDTRHFGWGTGTFASRGAVVVGSACEGAARAVRRKILALAGELLEVAEDDLRLAGGRVHVAGIPERGFDLGELAVRANPLRGAVKPGTEPGLEATSYFAPDMGSTASGVHAMVVEVDAETGFVDILEYAVVHDCGRVINPMIVEGQVQGGVAQGIGNAFYEHLDFDEEGQLLNASLMDYLIPTATVMPKIEVAHMETPSPLNPLGVKGVGEAGAIPVAAAFAQAVEDALSDAGVEIREIPLSPERVFELIQRADAEEGP